MTVGNAILNKGKSNLATKNRHRETPIFGEGEVVGGQWWYHSKEWWWFPIGSSLWPLPISKLETVTIRQQFAIECRRRSNKQGMGQFGVERCW